MLKDIYNMSGADRLFRTFLGVLLAYVGFFKPEIIGNNLLNIIVIGFGLMNIVSSIFCICPAYLLVNFSTKKSESTELEADTNTKVLKDSQQLQAASRLRLKLLLSVVIPMATLLVIFCDMLLDMSLKHKLSDISRSSDYASSVASHYLAMDTQAASDKKDIRVTEQTAQLLVQNGIKDAELFYFHDAAGVPANSPFDKGIEQSRKVNAISELHAKRNHLKDTPTRGTLSIDEKRYVWSSISAGLPNRWFTSLTPGPAQKTMYSQLFVPELIVIFFAMVVMSTWTSAYIIKKFLVSIENSARQLRHRTLHDALTGLPNRLSIEGIIEKRMASLNETSECIALLIIDIIDFRHINDTLGNSFGDKLLVEVANHLRVIDPENTDVVRLGGDVFCLVCTTDVDRLSVKRLSDQVHESLERTHNLDEVPVAVQLRVGVSFYPTDASKVEDLIRCSDIALAQAKSLRLKDCYFQREQDTHSLRKLTLLARLGSAIEQDVLTLVYQPKVDIQRNCLVGVEVLVRWHDEQYGMVSPIEFVTWAERSGLIDKLTRWVLIAAERQCSQWCDRGYVVPFSVNLSPTNLYDNELIPLVSRLIKNGRFSDGMLEFEITENAVMEDPDKALQTMNKLNELGVSFAIDDFGTGLSSFTYLRKFPVNNLKIDRAFIQDVDENDKDAVLLRSMINLGHGLGCVVTAEGVEEQESYEKLKSFGCDHVQGYLVCKPMAADDFVMWMDSSGWLSADSAA